MSYNLNTFLLKITIAFLSLFFAQSAFAGCWFLCGNIDRTLDEDKEKAINYFINENGFKSISSDKKESRFCRSNLSVLVHKDENEKMLSIKIGGKPTGDLTYLIENLKYDMDYGVFALSDKVSSDERCRVSHFEKEGTINELMVCSYKENSDLPLSPETLNHVQSTINLHECKE